MTIEWDTIVTSLLTRDDGRDRLRSQWLACCEVIENIDAYRPHAFASFPDTLSRVTVEELQGAADSERAAPHSVAFGSWRSHVTEIESVNAGRLLTLAATVHTLSDLYSKATDPDMVSARLHDLGAFLERAWRCRKTRRGVAIPMSGDLRVWSTRVTRRYDLLPLAWRDL